MPLSRKVSTADLSIALSITPRAVSKLTHQKILRREARGCYDLVDSIAAFIAHREAVVARAHGLGTYGRARAALYLERSRLARLRREELEGSLLPASETLAGWSALLAVFKTRMLAIPSKLAPRLVGIKSAAEIAAIIMQEIREALEDLANMEIRTVPRRGRRTRQLEQGAVD